MDFTGLRSLAFKPIRGLSKGMRQRLCLGRSMIHDPVVLILDEPAAGLDPRARIDLRKIIRSLAADNKTILISSHILTELAEMCDRVGILEQGKLLATGTVDEIRGGLRKSREIMIRVAENAEKALSILKPMEDVTIQSVDGLLIRIEISNGDEGQIAILRQLVHGEVELLEFSARGESLEDVFLQVTQGHVQ